MEDTIRHLSETLGKETFFLCNIHFTEGHPEISHAYSILIRYKIAAAASYCPACPLSQRNSNIVQSSVVLLKGDFSIDSQGTTGKNVTTAAKSHHDQ